MGSEMKRLKKSLGEEEVRALFGRLEEARPCGSPLVDKLIAEIENIVYEEIQDPVRCWRCNEV